LNKDKASDSFLLKNISRRKFLYGSFCFGALSLLGCAPSKLLKPDNHQRDKLRILFLTDIHYDGSNYVKCSLENSLSDLQSCKHDILIHGGDLITGGLDSPSKVSCKLTLQGKEFLNKINPEFYPCLGNHDHILDPNNGFNSGKEYFKKVFNLENTYYSFDALGYHFIVLDSIELNPDGSYLCQINDEQIEWLKRDLSKYSPSTPLILTLHAPLLSVRYQAELGAISSAPDDQVTINSNKIINLFKERNLALVLQGHLHVYEEIFWRKTLFLTGGAVSGAWWNGSWLGTKAGFCSVELRKEKPFVTYVTT
jgi:3',5'-cyclic-AMP phosphodiesterase